MNMGPNARAATVRGTYYRGQDIGPLRRRDRSTSCRAGNGSGRDANPMGRLATWLSGSAGFWVAAALAALILAVLRVAHG